ncbi:MAG: HAD family hydrolase, partial [Duodenibacillus sp.]
GFTILTQRMRARLNMTATCANRIEIEDGRFTGRVFGPESDGILDASGKKAFVEKTMASLGLPLDKAICCGDGSNDVKMIDAAGLGVGFRPKVVLRPHCDVVLDTAGFDALLTALS